MDLPHIPEKYSDLIYIWHALQCNMLVMQEKKLLIAPFNKCEMHKISLVLLL